MQHGFFKFWDWFDDRELLSLAFVPTIRIIILTFIVLQELGTLSAVSLEVLCTPA